VLVARKDDDTESVRRRLEVYLAETAALLGRFRDAGGWWRWTRTAIRTASSPP